MRGLTEQVVVGLTLVLERQTAVRDVVQVLEPLEERHGHTTGVYVQIGNDQNVAIDEDAVGGRGGRTVGGLGDDLRRKLGFFELCLIILGYFVPPYLGVDLAGVLAGDDLLDGGRDEDVTRLVHQVLTLVRLGAGEAHNGALLVAVILQLLGINSGRVEDRTVVLDDADAGRSGTAQIPARVQTHVTEALHDEGLATPSGCGSDHRHEVGLPDEVVQPVEDTPTGGGHTTVDSTLVDRLAGDASVRVNVQMADGLGVSVRNPGHLALTGAHVRSGHINTRPNEALLRKLEREATRDLLQLVLRVRLRVNLNTSLGTAERNVHTGTLEGHQSGQGFHLIAAHVKRETDTCAERKNKVKLINCNQLSSIGVLWFGETRWQPPKNCMPNLEKKHGIETRPHRPLIAGCTLPFLIH